jgi:hypothetical protein
MSEAAKKLRGQGDEERKYEGVIKKYRQDAIRRLEGMTEKRSVRDFNAAQLHLFRSSIINEILGRISPEELHQIFVQMQYTLKNYLPEKNAIITN